MTGAQTSETLAPKPTLELQVPPFLIRNSLVRLLSRFFLSFIRSQPHLVDILQYEYFDLLHRRQ